MNLERFCETCFDQPWTKQWIGAEEEPIHVEQLN